MSLEKAIKHNKEKRKQYTDNRQFDWSCRHGGSCKYCRSNRLFSNKRRQPEKSSTLLLTDDDQ